MTKRNVVFLAIAVAAVGALLSCYPRFIAGYDPRIEEGAARLQQTCDAFFTELESTAGTPAGAYDRHEGFYKDTRAEIARLRQVAAEVPFNRFTTESLALFEENLTELETAHRAGITQPEVPLLRDLVTTQLRMLAQLETAKKRGNTKEGA